MKIALIGEFDESFEPHVQTNVALMHSADSLRLDVEPGWVSTSAKELLHVDSYDALWFAPGSPYKNFARTLEALQKAREDNIPTFGTCGGFQHMVIEYARNALGISDAQHAEYDPYASQLIVSRLACSLAGREMQVDLRPDSRTAKAYGSSIANERYYCDFGINPEFVPKFAEADFMIAGTDVNGEPRVMEIPMHSFYIGTLFVPQARSTPSTPHPLISAFLTAANQRQLTHVREV